MADHNGPHHDPHHHPHPEGRRRYPEFRAMTVKAQNHAKTF